MNNGEISDEAVKLATEVKKDLTFYNEQAKKYFDVNSAGEICSNLAKWPEAILI